MGGDPYCRWDVTAGFTPGKPAERLREDFVVADEDWNDGDLPGRRLRDARRDAALSYAARLMSDEAICWVHVAYECPDAVWNRAAGDGDPRRGDTPEG